jgi:hypothetical protein
MSDILIEIIISDAYSHTQALAVVPPSGSSTWREVAGAMTKMHV